MKIVKNNVTGIIVVGFLLSGVLPVFGSSTTTKPSLGTRFKTSLSNAGSKIKTSFKNAGTKIKTGVTNLGTKLKTGAQNLKTKIKTGATKISTGIKNLATKAKTSLKATGAKIKEKAAALKVRVKDSLASAKEKLKSAGQKLKSGLKTAGTAISGHIEAAGGIGAVVGKLAQLGSVITTAVEASVNTLGEQKTTLETQLGLKGTQFDIDSMNGLLAMINNVKLAIERRGEGAPKLNADELQGNIQPTLHEQEKEIAAQVNGTNDTAEKAMFNAALNRVRQTITAKGQWAPALDQDILDQAMQSVAVHEEAAVDQQAAHEEEQSHEESTNMSDFVDVPLDGTEEE